MEINRQSDGEAVMNSIIEGIFYTEFYTRGVNLSIFVSQETLTLIKEYISNNNYFDASEGVLKIRGVEVKVAPDLSYGEFSIGVIKEECMEEEDSLDIKNL